MASAQMLFDIIARDGASGAFRAIGKEAEAAGGKVSGFEARINKIGKAAAGISVLFTAYAVDAAAKFQKLTNVYVTAAGESQKNLKIVQDGVLKIATNTGTAWQEVAAATYTAEKAGYRGADAYKVVEAAAQGAKEENANLATVTNAVTSIMASYHLKASDAVKVTDELKAAAGESKVSFEDFSGALSTVLPLASAAHITFADVAGAFATLTQHGTSANESTQELAATIRALTSISPAQQKAMAQIGLSANDVSQNLGTRGLTGTVNMLSEAVLRKMGPSGTVLLNTFNQSKQASADAQTEFDALSPTVQKLATQFENGQISAYQYSKDLRSVGGEQGVLGKQFLTTYTNAKGFQDTLKQGLTSNKTYTAEIKALAGGAIGLNTVLQLTGESAKATAARVKTVADAAKDAGTSVSGWASTQKLFSTQLDEFKQRVEVAAIRLGQDLLPVLTKIVGLFAQHPALMQAAATAVGVLAAAWVGGKIAGAIKAANSLARAILSVGAASTTAAAESEAAAGVSAGAGAAAGAGAGVAEGAAAGGLLSRLKLPPLLKIALPVAVTIAAVKILGLEKFTKDLLHGQIGPAIEDSPEWTRSISAGLGKALKSTRLPGTGGLFTGNLTGEVGGNLLPKPKPDAANAWNHFWATVDDKAKIADFQSSLKDINTLVVQNSGSLVGNSYAASTNRAGITALVGEAKSAAAAYARTTGKQSDYTAALNLAIPAIEAAAVANGLNKQQVDALINSLVRVPKETPANVILTGTKEAQAALADLMTNLRALAQPIIIPILTNNGLLGVASPNYAPTFGDIVGAQGGLNFGASGPGHISGGIGHAKGGIAHGWAMVGELGPELIHVGQPSRVYTNQETMALTRSGGGGVTVNLTVSAVDPPSFKSWLRREGAQMVQAELNQAQLRGQTFSTR